MRNLIEHREIFLEIGVSLSSGPAVSVHSDSIRGSAGDLVVCTRGGTLARVPVAEGKLLAWDLNKEIDSGDVDDTWFYSASIVETNSVFMASRKGTLASVKAGEAPSSVAEGVEVEGYIDAGIASALWSPDQSSLAIVTRANTLLIMTDSFDVLQELPVTPMAHNSECALSWSGDGEYLSMLSTDEADNIARVRTMTKHLEAVSTGRGVQDGPAGVVKDLCSSMLAFAPNASLIASVQRKAGGKYQVVFFEKNGLRHGEFDVRLGDITVDADFVHWEPDAIRWDMSSSMIGVGFRRKQGAPASSVDSFVQLYYRENYHWYLKQQWSGVGLRVHGFDQEVSGRLLLSDSADVAISGLLRIRIIDLVWDVTATATSDCTVAVVDGAEVRMTSLGQALVPPPMSLYSTPKLIRPVRHSAFWGRPDGTWGMGLLLDGNNIQLFFGSEDGRQGVSNAALSISYTTGPIDLNALLSANGLVPGSCRQLLVMESSAQSEGDQSAFHVIVVVTPPRNIGTTLKHSTFVEDYSSDNILAVRIEKSQDGKWIATLRGTVCFEDATIGSITHWGAEGRSVIDGVEACNAEDDICDSNSTIAVSLLRSNLTFVVCKVAIPTEQFTEIISSLSLHSGIYFIPESCYKVSVLPMLHNDNNEEPSSTDTAQTAIIGLSSRNHLYCGEIMLATGVSSIALNTHLDALLYGTVGTRPALHFIPISTLQSMDPMRAIDDTTAPVTTWSCSEPRPLERGARIIAAVADSSKVVLQMPRGNLEGIEPRWLAIRKARAMLRSDLYYDCLVFLRRQRIDLNLMHDDSPSNFFANVAKLVQDCVSKTSCDFLSLFLSSLDPADVTSTKYASDYQDRKIVISDAVEDKVNKICSAIRQSLLPFVLHKQASSSDNRKKTSADSVAVVQAMLCSYAKQQPAMLTEALSLIKVEILGLLDKVVASSEADVSAEIETLLSDKSATASLGKILSTSKAQSLIKYVAFLVEKEALFNAALSDCDFSMCRAVAKQCQMDPKVYLPLLTEFESIGSTTWGIAPEVESNDYDRVQCRNFCFMKFRVHEHLKRYQDAVEWGARMLALFTAQEDDSVEVNRSAIAEELVELFEKNDLQEAVVTFLRRTISDGNFTVRRVKFDVANVSSLKNLLSSTLKSLGLRLMAVGKARSAVNAFLCSEPADFANAIAAARSAKEWLLALSISQRAHLEKAVESKAAGIISPRDLAASIIDDFEAGLEQGQTESDDYFEFFPSAVDFSLLNKPVEFSAKGSSSNDPRSTTTSAVASSSSHAVHDDRSLEVANLCIDYLGDADRAVSIMTLSRRWTQAAQVAIKASRNDLVAEVRDNVRHAFKDAMKSLQFRSERHTLLVAQLKKLWAEPAARLEAVVATEAALATLIEREGKAIREGLLDSYAAMADQAAGGAEGRSVVFGGPDDGRSEYSRATLRSYTSDASIRSGMSTVSVLSNLSRFSSSGSAVSDRSSFSISGIEHALLSRGSAADGEKEMNAKQRKRFVKHQKGNKGGAHGGQDIHGLRSEIATCTELCKYCDVSVVSRAVLDVISALMLLADFGSSDIANALSLQSAMNAYVSLVASNAPPPAPLYPVEWLIRKEMAFIRCFQEWPEPSHDDAGPRTYGSVKNRTLAGLLWWGVAAGGILEWREARVDVLEL